MASTVKIDIPGIGKIEADNAATESTLRELIEVMKKSDFTKRKEEKRAQQEYEREQEKATKGLKDHSEGMKDNAEAGKKILKDGKVASGEATASLGKLAKAQMASKLVVLELANTLGSLAQTAISLTTAMMTSYDAMKDDPINAALTVMQTEVDATATLYKGATSAILVGAGALFGGPVGAAIGGVIAEGIGKLFDMGAEAQKLYNDQMAKEIKKSVTALGEFSKMGASFAGGMTEMRNTANAAGLSLDTMTKMATKAAGDLGQSGLTHADAVKKMADGMKGLATTNGKSGAKLRDEMLAMGYSYEEQGEVMASYMAQQRAAGKDLKNLAPAELAQGAREYATNLKVISDITGQDAKKLMEKARAESMRAALSNKLSADQNKAFQAANSTLSKFGPEVQNALTQFMATGTVTDPAIAANKELMSLIQDTANSVKEGDKNITAITGDRMKAAAEGMKNDQTLSAASTANLMGASDGAAGAIGKLADTVMAAGQTIGSASESAKTAEAQASLAGTTGSVEQGFANITSKTQDLAVEMEKLTGSHLGEFAGRAAEGFKSAEEAVTKMAKAIDSVHSSTIQPAADAGAKTLEKAPSFLEKLASHLPFLADGGTVSGPDSGYLAMLHGTETVIPEDVQGKLMSAQDPKELMDKFVNVSMDDMQKKFISLTSTKGLLDSLTKDSLGNGAEGNISESFKAAYNQIADAITALKAANPNLKEDQAITPNLSNDMLKDLMDGVVDKLSDMHKEVMDKHEEMIGNLRDHKDLTQKLINVTM